MIMGSRNDDMMKIELFSFSSHNKCPCKTIFLNSDEAAKKLHFILQPAVSEYYTLTNTLAGVKFCGDLLETGFMLSSGFLATLKNSHCSRVESEQYYRSFVSLLQESFLTSKSF